MARSAARQPQSEAPAAQFEPRMPGLSAVIVCTIAALTLLWPLLTGHILFGGERSDMYIAGYSFRLFGAETFKATGSIPQWNPYLLGGLPYIAAMHGDIFYPTAWLRWIMPVDLAITWGMAIHFVLAGWLTYMFARALGLSWSAATTAAVAYELSGIVASQMSPGHDGKLFVSALTPLAFWALLRAIRDGRQWGYGVIAFVVALTVLGHYNMSYFLLIALGLWTLYLAFWDPTRTSQQKAWVSVGLAALSVVVGIGITSLQALPFLEYVKFSPRAEGGPDTGFAFATSYAMPPKELFTLILPQFNGVLDHYWGQNPIKFHTEYVGMLPLALVVLAWGDKARRRLVVTFTIGAAVFLLFAFGGYSPLYRALFNVLPYLSKIRAMGMVFFLPAFFLAMLAGIGMDRVLRGAVSARTVLYVTGGFALFALLGVTGALQSVAEAMSIPERISDVQANAGELRTGAMRLLFFAVLNGAALWMMAARRTTAPIGTAAILVLLAADLWSIDRQFYEFSPRASVLFRDDAITTYLKKTPQPYRVLDAGNGYGQSSILMAYGIANPLGYHGFELRFYDELGGKANGWQNLLTPNLMELLSVRFLIVGQPADVPGFHQVVPPTTTATGRPAVLYEKDSVPAYARVMLTAAKLPEDQDVSALVDPRFPFDKVAIYPDTSTAAADSIAQPFPASAVRASVSAWSPGRMAVSLSGADPRGGHLVVSENWYPDWHATVDGRSAAVRRADHSLLSVDVPSGAKEVKLWFQSPAYARGKLISIGAVLSALLMIAVAVARERRALAVMHDD
jgi:Bacterial membrane protein YfhO